MSNGNEVKEALRQKGFKIEHQGGGCTWACKDLSYKGREAYIAITLKDFPAAPESLNEPITVGMYYYNSDDGKAIQLDTYNTLKEYLERV